MLARFVKLYRDIFFYNTRGAGTVVSTLTIRNYFSAMRDLSDILYARPPCCWSFSIYCALENGENENFHYNYDESDKKCSEIMKLVYAGFFFN